MLNKEDPLHHHRLFVFLGVDMVGSTAFKQGQEALLPPREGIPRWFSAFKLFYSCVESTLAKLWPQPAGEPPLFWKAAGDELLYIRELKEWHQALTAVNVWRLTVGDCRRTISAEFPALDLKATAWLANFPIPNTQIALPISQSERPQADYLGPSMDLGFRLGSLASPTRLVVSVGLALMVAEALSERADGHADCVLGYGGATVLKGLLGGTTYPAFWVDMRTDRDQAAAEDRLLGKPTATLEDIITVSRGKIGERSEYFFEPYIDPTEYPGNTKFNRVPDPHRAALAALQEPS